LIYRSEVSGTKSAVADALFIIVGKSNGVPPQLGLKWLYYQLFATILFDKSMQRDENS
jgi:hypothetical protein